MKYHLNIILLALRAAIIIVIGMVAYHAFGVYANIADPNGFAIVSSYFKMQDFIIPTTWGAPLFLSLYSILLAYLVVKLIKLYKSLNNLQKGNVFYEQQSAEFKSAGSGIIIFAKCKYLLFCAAGTLIYANIWVFFTELASFFALYLIGKFVLVLYYMAQKGEYLREENDLTI
jgi:hypothetical protein